MTLKAAKLAHHRSKILYDYVLRMAVSAPSDVDPEKLAELESTANGCAEYLSVVDIHTIKGKIERAVERGDILLTPTVLKNIDALNRERLLEQEGQL